MTNTLVETVDLSRSAEPIRDHAATANLCIQDLVVRAFFCQKYRLRGILQVVRGAETLRAKYLSTRTVRVRNTSLRAIIRRYSTGQIPLYTYE